MGKILLKSGAETYRVEDTISRCCLAHGYEVDPFVTPTVIILGNEDTDSFIRVSRIGYRSTNLSLISEMNSMSLSLISEMNSMSYNFAKWDMGYEDTCKWLDKKWRQPAPYGKWMVCLASGIGSAAFAAMLGGNSHEAFAAMLGGNSHDFIAAFITGGAAMVALKQIAGYHPSAFWENAVAGVVIATVALICCAMSVQCTMEKIIVGALMPFVPGVAFCNGLRDYMAGNLMSGNSRIAEGVCLHCHYGVCGAVSGAEKDCAYRWRYRCYRLGGFYISAA